MNYHRTLLMLLCIGLCIAVYQIDADETSAPRWRVGGEIAPESSIDDRFARGFEHAAGKDGLYFKLDDEFFIGHEPKRATIRIIWYDQHAGSSWKPACDAGHAQMETTRTFTGQGGSQWRTETTQLTDAVLDRGGDRGCDFAPVNTDDKDELFSLIEFHHD